MGLLDLLAYGPHDETDTLSMVHYYGWEWMHPDTKEELIEHSRILLANGDYGKDSQKAEKMINDLVKRPVPEDVIKRGEMWRGERPFPGELWWTKPRWIMRKLKGEI